MSIKTEKCPLVPGSIRAKLHAHFVEERNAAKANLVAFAKKIQGSETVHAMQWADSAFTSAAKEDVATNAIYLLEHSEDVSFVAEVLHERLINKVRWCNNKSTSTSSNYLNDCILTECTAAYEHVRAVTRKTK